MNMKIKDSIAWAAFGAVMAIIMFPSCSDENEAGILEITNNEIILQAEGTPVQVEVKSNTEWRIDFAESTWFSTDIRGAQSSRTYFTVTVFFSSLADLATPWKLLPDGDVSSETVNVASPAFKITPS